MDLDGSDKFSDQNPKKFGAWSKVLPERDQKRSGRENHMILESNTETCSKHDFSMIFVGYSSRIFCDFDGFPQISQFLHTVDRFHDANWCQMRSFSWSFMDPSNFRIKIHKISALGAKC